MPQALYVSPGCKTYRMWSHWLRNLAIKLWMTACQVAGASRKPYIARFKRPMLAPPLVSPNSITSAYKVFVWRYNTPRILCVIPNNILMFLMTRQCFLMFLDVAGGSALSAFVGLPAFLSVLSACVGGARPDVLAIFAVRAMKLFTAVAKFEQYRKER